MTDVPLHRHWSDIYRLRWWILFTSVCAAAVAYIYSSNVTPIFEARTTFYLASNAEQPSYIGAALDAPPGVLYPTPEEKAASLDIGILRGREIMQRLADEFDLPIGEIQKRVDAKVSGEFMLSVYARNSDPELAAQIAHTARSLYQDFHERSMRERAALRAAALEEQLAEFRAERSALRQSLQTSRETALSTADSIALQRLQIALDDATADLDRINGQIVETDARIASIDTALDVESDRYEKGLTLATTDAMIGMQEMLLQLRVDLASNTDGPSSPRRLAMEKQIKDLETSILREESKLVRAEARSPGSLYEALRLERAMAVAQLEGLTALRPSATNALADATKAVANALGDIGLNEEISTRVSWLDQLISTAEENLAAAKLQAAYATPPLVLVEEAVPPTRPAFPLVALNTIVAAMCGMIFGAYYALFVAHSQRAARVRRAETENLPVFTPEELDRLVFAGIEIPGGRRAGK